MKAEERIRWAPKVQPSKIRRLYQNDAAGLVEEALVDDVGLTLLDRCRSILMVARSEVECPRCGRAFICTGAERDLAPIDCPTTGCGWKTTSADYRASWRHRDLNGSNAAPAFASFVEQYPRAGSPRQRMLLIDRLIHAFHQDLRRDVPNRSAANNLIEGSHDHVVALLDTLAYGDASTPELEAYGEEWRSKAQAMQGRRRCTSRNRPANDAG